MNIQDTLIIALDVPTTTHAKKIVNSIGDHGTFYKVGLELFTSKDAWPFIEWLHTKNKKIFVDLKLFDIPETISKAISNLNNLGVTYTTVHGCYEDGLLAAVESSNDDLGILSVTLLTSQRNDQELQLVCERASVAKKVGCVGAVMSGLEASSVRLLIPDDFKIICPGIRDPDNKPDDQRRVITVEDAIKNGASHLVVGRPITKSFDIALEAKKYQKRILTISKQQDGLI